MLFRGRVIRESLSQCIGDVRYIHHFTTVSMKVTDFTAGVFARYFTYHGPDLLDGSTGVNFGYVISPGFMFCGFYSASGFGPDDSVIFEFSGGRVGLDFLECFTSVSCSFFALYIQG